MMGFNPFGLKINNTEPVVLKFEEYESLRLINYNGLRQENAAREMNISRPTFTRIYNKALKQISKSFVEGRTIVIEGGNFKFDKVWYRCKKCHALIQGIENHTRCKNCILYSVDELIKINQ